MGIKENFRPFIIFCLLLSVIFSAACGKKGPPTLASFEKPDSPSQLNAHHLEDRIILRWNYPKAKESKIKEFVLLKSSGGDFIPIGLIEVKSRSFEDRDFKLGTNYRYKVLAKNLKDVLSLDSNTVVVIPSEPPRPPDGISSRVEGMGLILTWEGVGNDVLYNVYKGYEKGKYGAAPVNAIPLAETSFMDALDIHKTVYYAIRSIMKKTGSDEGPLSRELIASPDDLLPSAPKNVRAFAAADSVYLSWDASAEPWTMAYRIYRRIGNGEFVAVGDTQIPSYRDGDSPALMREYRITAVGPVREGQAAEVKGIVFLPQE